MATFLKQKRLYAWITLWSQISFLLLVAIHHHSHFLQIHHNQSIAIQAADASSHCCDSIHSGQHCHLCDVIQIGSHGIPVPSFLPVPFSNSEQIVTYNSSPLRQTDNPHYLSRAPPFLS